LCVFLPPFRRTHTHTHTHNHLSNMLVRDEFGIVISTYERYIVTGKKRRHIAMDAPTTTTPMNGDSGIVYEFKEAPPNTTVFHTECHLFPPMLLNPIAWDRYGYSKRDILKMYESSPASEVWQLSFMLSPKSMQLESSVCGVKPRLNDIFCFNYVARKTVFLNMLSHRLAFTKTQDNDTLCNENLPQGIYLPVVLLRNNLCKRMRSSVANVTYPPNQIPNYSDKPLFDILNARYLAIQKTGNGGVKLCRVIPSSAYSNMECPPLYTPVNQPRQFRHTDILYVLTEECVFAKPKRTRKRKLDSTTI